MAIRAASAVSVLSITYGHAVGIWRGIPGMPSLRCTGVEADTAMPRLLGTPLAADLEATAGACHAVMPGGRVLLGCGFWDNSIRHAWLP